MGKILKKIKFVFFLLIILGVFPLLFSCNARASEIMSDPVIPDLPIATSDTVDININTSDIPMGSTWDFSFPVWSDDNDTKFGKVFTLIFSMPVEMGYIQNYINNQSDIRTAYLSGQLSSSDYLAIYHNYQLCWLHVLLNLTLISLIFGFMFRRFKVHLR